MSNWKISPLNLELKNNWVISRGESKTRENFIVEFFDETFKGLGEVAFVTGGEITSKEVKEAFDYFLQTVPKNLDSLEELNAYLESHDEKIPNNLRIAIEQSFLSYVSQLVEQDVGSILGLKSSKRVSISYSLPIMKADELREFITKNSLERFSCLKLKVTPDNAKEVLEAIRECYQGNLIIDANESFEKASEIEELAENFTDLNILFWEQPFPKSSYHEYRELFKLENVKVMADESIMDGEITNEHAELFNAINVKLSKTGSFLKAMKQMHQAKALGLEVMIGCMIESSLGIHRALQIAELSDFFDLDSFLLLNNDPFNLVYEENGKVFQSEYQ